MHTMDMISDVSSSARNRILFLLKMHGPQTTAQMAKTLAVTTMAVRQHLSILEKEMLVNSTNVRHKVGRPARLWQLTSKVTDQFPDYHAEFAVGMLETIRSTFGEVGLERLAKERTRKQIQSYSAKMPDQNAPIEKRLDALVRIRGEEGYMAEWRREKDGTFKLIENHCSIANAAECCSKLCSEELSLFRTILGKEVHIDQVNHILKGDRCCAFHITNLANVVRSYHID